MPPLVSTGWSLASGTRSQRRARTCGGAVFCPRSPTRSPSGPLPSSGRPADGTEPRHAPSWAAARNGGAAAGARPSDILDRMDRRKLRHMMRLASIFWSYRTGATTVPQLPVRLWIESTSRCNLRCGYCPNKDVVKEDHGFMDFGLYTSIIDQVADH